MYYIQNNLTITPYEIPGVNYLLTKELYLKYLQYQGFSKLVINENNELIDIIEDPEKENRERKIEEEDSKRQALRNKKNRMKEASKEISEKTSMLEAMKQIYPSLMSATTSSDNYNDEILKFSGLFDNWENNIYSIGDYRKYNHQVWKCIVAHDSLTATDINPTSPIWHQFWIPIHSTSKKFARKWFKPENTEDTYKTGEYMWYIDYELYKCISDTILSPEEAPECWEIQE